MDAAKIVGDALEGTGLNLVGGCGIEVYDRRAPLGFRSETLMPRARGLVVVGSAGRKLWEEMRAALGEDAWWEDAHPLDEHMARTLDRADLALARAGVGSRRFEPRVGELASNRLDFRALGELAGLGSMGPFGLVIHPVHGPWWALRGAWLVDVPISDPPFASAGPCVGCPATCLGGTPEGGIAVATAAVRSRCVVGQESRYSDEQLTYHYDRPTAIAALQAASRGEHAAKSV